MDILRQQIIHLQSEIETIAKRASQTSSLDIGAKKTIVSVVHEINERIIAKYIDMFAEYADNGLYDLWFANRTCFQLAIAKHKQSYMLCVAPRMKKIPFWFVFSKFHTVPSQDVTRLQKILSDPKCSNSVARAELKTILRVYNLQSSFLTGQNILKTRVYMQFHPKSNPIQVLLNCVDNNEPGNHNITRHPAWCAHNLDAECDIFATKCHTSVNCPFFLKCEQIAPGVHRYKTKEHNV